MRTNERHIKFSNDCAEANRYVKSTFYGVQDH